MSNEACEWCAQTSSQIDGIEYENEVLKKQVENLTAVNQEPLFILHITGTDPVVVRGINGAVEALKDLLGASITSCTLGLDGCYGGYAETDNDRIYFSMDKQQEVYGDAA